MAIDLHTHSLFSDGVQRPQELVDTAVDRGLSVLSLTDHDSVSGVKEAVARGVARGIEVIPGIEISANYGLQEFHVLGYSIDYTSSSLRQELARWASDKYTQIKAMCARLVALGFDIRFSRVEELGKGQPLMIPLIARVLVEQGYMSSVDAARNQLLHKAGPIYVPRQTVGPVEAIKLIRQHGGVPVLAHPAVSGNVHAIPKLLAAGLAGIEVYYPRHRRQDEQRLLNLAQVYGLLVTGGSDYHGPDGPHSEEGTDLGCVSVPRVCVTRLQAAYRNSSVRNKSQRSP